MTTRDPLPSGASHRIEYVNGIRLHMVEAGTGPLVLLVHGFPESWYSWRHQIAPLANAGFHVVAIDVRGYGRSSKPVEIERYRMLELVADNVALVNALGADQAVVVGHDWGAPIAWNSALRHPEIFRAVAGLSVPYSPGSDVRPLTAFRAMAGDEEFYIEYFQQPGRAEAEIEADVRGWLHGFTFSGSGDAWSPSAGGSIATIPRGAKMRDRFRFPDTPLPWFDDDDLAFYEAEFERTGITGGLNRYRNVERDFDDLADQRGKPITVPAMFIGGDRDGPTIWGAPAIERFPETLPRLYKSMILEGCGHWTQQERPAEVTAALLDFLRSLS